MAQPQIGAAVNEAAQEASRWLRQRRARPDRQEAHRLSATGASRPARSTPTRKEYHHEERFVTLSADSGRHRCSAACAPGALPPIEAPTTAPTAARSRAGCRAPAAAAWRPAATQAIAQPGPEIIAPAAPVLAGTAWIMSSLNGALPVAEATVTLQFGMDGSASGSDGCNRYTTTYNQLGDALTFTQPMAGTMMACADPIMAQAAEYQKALAG